VPGGLEAITRSLGLFANLNLTLTDAVLAEKLAGVRETFSGEFAGQSPVFILLGGADDGKVFPIREDSVALGREDPGASGRAGQEIVLGEEYAAVTRVSRPHARLTRRQDAWFIEDCGSTGGTFLNGTQVERGARRELRDGDLVELAKGAPGATSSSWCLGGCDRRMRPERTVVVLCSSPCSSSSSSPPPEREAPRTTPALRYGHRGRRAE
jgi:hypothetical protein